MFFWTSIFPLACFLLYLSQALCGPPKVIFHQTQGKASLFFHSIPSILPFPLCPNIKGEFCSATAQKDVFKVRFSSLLGVDSSLVLRFE